MTARVRARLLPGARTEGCHTASVARPAGTPFSVSRPAASVIATCGVAVTKMKAIIVSWMLQPIATTLGFSNYTGLVSSRP